MSVQRVPPLQDLVMEYVLRNEALPFPNLENLTRVLIVQLYREALMGGHVEMVKKMALSCPLACLPLGYLWRTRNTQALMTILEGLGSLLDQQTHPSQWKLKALDFRNGDQDSAFLGSTAPLGACSQGASHPGARRRRRPRRAKQRFKIFIHLVMQEVLGTTFLWRLQSFVLERRASVRIYSEKLTFSCWYKCELLSTLPLDYVQEVEVDGTWGREHLERFFSYLSRLRNLRVFRFSSMSPRFFTCRSFNRWFTHKYSLQLRKLDRLQEFSVTDVFFLQGSLHKILLSETPLETLSLTLSPLRESDLKHLAVCRSTDHLKNLKLRGSSLKGMSPQPLRDLLGKVAGTLETLVLDHCDITDSQLNAIVPALALCSQLRTFCFSGNPTSPPALKTLLGHTARLKLLTCAEYPVPLELHPLLLKPFCAEELDPESFDPLWRELTELVEDVRPGLDVQLCYTAVRNQVADCCVLRLGPADVTA